MAARAGQQPLSRSPIAAGAQSSTREAKGFTGFVPSATARILRRLPENGAVCPRREKRARCSHLEGSFSGDPNKSFAPKGTFAEERVTCRRRKNTVHPQLVNR